MANIKIKRVPGDLGSQQVAQLQASYNSLVDALGTLITGLKTAADAAAINALAVTAEAALEANVTKLYATPRTPLQPQNEARTR